MTDAEILSLAITASGLSARRFATAILSRDERTVRRWLAGETMPPVVRDWLAKWLELSDRQRGIIVRALAD